jgi:hypothetical protein
VVVGKVTDDKRLLEVPQDGTWRDRWDRLATAITMFEKRALFEQLDLFTSFFSTCHLTHT